MYKLYPNYFSQPPGRKSKTLLIMKLTSLLLTLGIMQVSATSLAQKITLQEKNAPLNIVFEDIRQQTGYDFLFTKTLLKNAKPVSIDVRNVDLQVVLSDIFKNQDFDYEISDMSVLIKKRTDLPADSKQTTVNLIDVRGRVFDEQGSPIPGATVTVKGTTHSINTDGAGYFTIKGIDDKSILVITVIGYQPKEMAVQSYMGNIKMSLSASKLDDVQVIAYGTATERTEVGSIAKVSSEEIMSQPVLNPLEALEGRVAGLLVTTSSGTPGSALKIQIRGQNTIGSVPSSTIVPDNPLFIIDGIPFAPQNTSINRVQGVNDANGVGSPGSGISPFNSIDPADIESIEVLKDADATSIYGARGANGVILITTKSGKAGKTKLTGNLYTGVNSLTRTMPLLNTDQYLKMREEAFANDGIKPTANPGNSFAPDLKVFDTTRNINYLKQLYGTNASTQNADLALSGGDAHNTFYFSLGYDRQTYLFPGDFVDDRLNGNFRIHHTSSDNKFIADVSAGYSYDRNDVPGTPTILSAYTLAPDFPALTNPDGSLKWDYKGINYSSYFPFGSTNPMAYLKRSDIVGQYSFLSSLLLSYEILPGLKIKTVLGYNTLTANEFSTYPASAQNPASSPLSVANKSINNFYTYDAEPQISYDKQLGKEKFSLLAGGTLEKIDNNYVGIAGSGFSNDLLLGSISSAKTITSTDGNTPYKYSAGFGRINYTHDDEYIVDLTGRYDGSSRFAPGKQWGRFGSAAGGWIFTKEKSVKDVLPFMSFGKIKASYGTTGNDNVGNSLYTSNWSALATSYLYNGSVGYLPKNLENPDFSWSTTRKIDAGLDLGFLSDRILLSADWFRDRSSNQLVQYQLPSQTGFSIVTQNFQADVQNKGWEFLLSGTVLKQSAFTWKTSFNVTIPQNKLIAFPGLASSSYANYLVIGQSVNTIFGYKYVDVNPTTGVYEFMTKAGTVSSTPSAAKGDNKFIIGNTDPKLYGGWRNTFGYKGFQLDLFFEFRKQKGLDYMSSFTEAVGNEFNVPVDALNVWTKPGDIATYERLTSQTFGTAASNAFTYYRTSSGVFTDASYIRLKTAGVSYALKSNWIQVVGMSSCRLFVNAQNLLTFTKYKGNDPETQNYYDVPPIRTVAAGVNFGF